MSQRNPYQGPRQPRFLPELCGPINLVTPPASNALAIDKRNQASSLAMAKLHLRVSADQTGDDDVITQYLQTATRYCEDRIDGGRTFLLTTFDMPIVHWWFDQSGLNIWGGDTGAGLEGGRQMEADGMREQLPFPRPPLSSVTSVTYYDSNGNLQTLASSYYLVRKPWRQQGTIERASLQVFPAVAPDYEWPITIRFVAGYGDGLTTFPPVEVQQAILVATGWMYADREPTNRELDVVDQLLRTVSYGGYA